MALKEYWWRGNRWQFDDSDVPAGAVPVKGAEKPQDKAAKTAQNKGRTAKKKDETEA